MANAFGPLSLISGAGFKGRILLSSRMGAIVFAEVLNSSQPYC
jgi:hypothetical protein